VEGRNVRPYAAGATRVISRADELVSSLRTTGNRRIAEPKLRANAALKRFSTKTRRLAIVYETARITE
jgi:hypothetical protein